MSTIIPNVLIRSAVRMSSSRNGNPRWKLFTDHGNFTTQTDGSIGYVINNLTNSRFDTYAIGDNAPPCDLVVTRSNSGVVVDVQRNGKHLS